VDATKAHYLITEAIPSPMGEFLTAFETAIMRDKTFKELKGTPLSWSELKTKFDVTF
jgi:copper chaperone NosL